MAFQENYIRNICLLGHRGNGKTSLAESLLYWNGKTDRLGTIQQGNTVCDYDPEEIKRKTTVNLSAVHVDYKDYKINLIDAPGFYDFEGENVSAVAAADAALIVVSAKQTVSVGAEKAMALTKKNKKSKAIYITFLDDENADYLKTVEQLNTKFGAQQLCKVWLPIFDGQKLIGYVDVINEKAARFGGESMAVPDDLAAEMQSERDKLIELVAETDDELMNKYFEGEAFSEQEMTNGVRAAIAQRLVYPILFGIPTLGIGNEELADFVARYFPSPAESGATATAGDIPLALDFDSAQPAAIVIFKTIVDPFVGKLSYFKVLSGTLKKDITLVNARTGAKEKLGTICTPFGKKQENADELYAGDIGVVSKLATAATGDVLRDPACKIDAVKIEFPVSNYARAVVCAVKGEEEKMSAGIQRMIEQDPTLKLVTNKETKQTVLYGLGDTQLDILVNRLSEKPFSVKVLLEDVKVAYRETIRKKVKVEGKHKKQSGGHGQYGHVWIEFEPSTEDFEFCETVFGGSVPKNYFPAVEKGLRESIQTGVLAGYPVTGLKATLVDGSYHPVDSSEMAFKIAAGIAFKEGMKQASPTMLEPIGRLAVNVSDALMGDIIGDINKRRGQVLAMDPAPEFARKIVQADVPMSEMNDYAMNLRSMTHGRATFVFDFLEYREAPAPIIEKIVQNNK